MPGRASAASTSRPAPTRASTTRSPAATAGGSSSDGPDAVQAHGQNTENAPVEETELNYPVRITQLALVENSEGAGPHARRARAAQGLPLRPARRRSRSSPTATGSARGARSAGTTARSPSTSLIRDGAETRLRLEDDGRARAGRRDQRPDVRRRRLRAARGARAGARPARRASRARWRSSAPARSTGSSSTGRASSIDEADRRN